MEKKIRIGAVSYLNTRPLLYGLKEHPVAERIILREDYPARVASMLLNDEIDIGLVPGYRCGEFTPRSVIQYG